jgi:hypothetical protein
VRIKKWKIVKTQLSVLAFVCSKSLERWVELEMEVAPVMGEVKVALVGFLFIFINRV